MMDTSQPIGEIAYDGGISDYSHFARIFRRRFGYSPGAHAGTPLRSGAPPYG
jgi:AraC-like DNA-binding protein